MIVGLRPGFSPTAPRAPVKLSLERLHAGARRAGGSAPGHHPLWRPTPRVLTLARRRAPVKLSLERLHAGARRAGGSAPGHHPLEANASGIHPRQTFVCSPFRPGRPTRSSQSWPRDRRSPFQAHTCVYTILSHSRVGLDMTGDMAALRGITLQLRPMR